MWRFHTCERGIWDWGLFESSFLKFWVECSITSKNPSIPYGFHNSLYFSVIVSYVFVASVGKTVGDATDNHSRGDDCIRQIEVVYNSLSHFSVVLNYFVLTRHIGACVIEQWNLILHARGVWPNEVSAAEMGSANDSITLGFVSCSRCVEFLLSRA